MEHGQPQDGLTLLQFGQAKAWDIATDDERSMADRTAHAGGGGTDLKQVAARLELHLR